MMLTMEVDIAYLKTTFPAETTDTEEILRVWDNMVGTFYKELYDAGHEQHLDIHSIAPIGKTGRSAEADRTKKGEFVGADLMIEWGPVQ